MVKFSKNGAFHLYHADDIIRIETESSVAGRENRCVVNGDGNFTHVYLSNGEKFVVCRQIGEWKKILKEDKFFRSHQSHLANVSYAARIETKSGWELILETGNQLVGRVPVTNGKRAELLRILGLK